MCKILKSIINVDEDKKKNKNDNKKIKLKNINMNMSITNQGAFSKSAYKSGTKIIIIFVLLLSTSTLTSALQQQQQQQQLQQQQEKHKVLSAEDNVRRSVDDSSKTNYAAMADSMLSIDADTDDHDDDEEEEEEEPATSIREQLEGGGDLSNSSDMDFDETVATPLNVGVMSGARMRGGSAAGNAVTNKPINALCCSCFRAYNFWFLASSLFGFIFGRIYKFSRTPNKQN